MLSDDIDPMVSVMKIEKAPTETYADVGGLDAQIQEIKVFELIDFIFSTKGVTHFRNLLNYHLLTQNITKKSVLNRRKVSFCTDHRVLVKRYLQKR